MQDEVPHVALDAAETPGKVAATSWTTLISVAIGIAALITSLVSIWLGIKNAGSMNQLVQANSWPHLQVTTGNIDESGERALYFRVENAGAGPAKLYSLSVQVDGTPVSGPLGLLRDCCDMDYRGEDGSPVFSDVITTRPAQSVLRPGERNLFFHVPLAGSNPDAWSRLDAARFSSLSFSGCYCSVFDECWITDFEGLEKSSVETCPLSEQSWQN